MQNTKTRLTEALGDRAFITRAMAIALPVLLQGLITNGVGFLDNVMVGSLGTAQISGVAVSNQLLFLFNLCVFGALSGPGIFGAQFFGAGNLEGVKSAFRLKLLSVLVIVMIALGLILFADVPLISLFLQGEGEKGLAEAILSEARGYLKVMMPGILLFALTQCYVGTLREMGETRVQMMAGLIAVGVNLVGNWLLIFGSLGFPAWGVKGAAVATVISRLTELSVIALYAHRDRFKPLFRGIYHSFKIPREWLWAMLQKGLPLMLNELFWSLGVVTLTRIYSLKGLQVLAGLNIANVAVSLFNVFFFSLGSAVAVLVGQTLGSGEIERAQKEAKQLMRLAFIICVFSGATLALLSPFFPRFYNTSQEVRDLACHMILVASCLIPFNAVTHCAYFAMRAGGSSLVTFLFDSGFTWALLIPIGLGLTHLTGMDIRWIYPLTEGTILLKCAVSVYIIRDGRWAKNIVAAS